MYSPPAQKLLIRTERNGTARGQNSRETAISYAASPTSQSNCCATEYARGQPLGLSGNDNGLV